MDKSYSTEFVRRFVVETLPDPLTRASAHVQIFDNFIPGTRLRIRRVRIPESREWTISLEHRFPAAADRPGEWRVNALSLNEAEHAQLRIFEGEEVRKNRYFHETGDAAQNFDLYLGPLWGLCIARVEFGDRAAMTAYEPSGAHPDLEITGDPFFFGGSLANATIETVREHLSRNYHALPPTLASDTET